MDSFMNKVRQAFGKSAIVEDERGLSTVEYVIILVLIAAAAIGIWTQFGGTVQQKIQDSNQEMGGIQVKGE